MKPTALLGQACIYYQLLLKGEFGLSILSPHGLFCLFFAYFYILFQHNTFQAIFTTDGYRTYSLYAYDADALQWSVPTIRDPRAKYGHAVMGFTVPGHSYSDPRSATVSIARLDNVVDPNNKYLLPQSCDSGALYIYQLYDQNSIEGPRTQCLRWYHQQPPPRNWTTGLPPCPPLLRQAQSDARYRQSSKRLPRLCYLSTVPSAVGAGKPSCTSA